MDLTLLPPWGQVPGGLQIPIRNTKLQLIRKSTDISPKTWTKSIILTKKTKKQSKIIPAEFEQIYLCTHLSMGKAIENRHITKTTRAKRPDTLQKMSPIFHQLPVLKMQPSQVRCAVRGAWPGTPGKVRSAPGLRSPGLLHTGPPSCLERGSTGSQGTQGGPTASARQPEVPDRYQAG